MDTEEIQHAPHNAVACQKGEHELEIAAKSSKEDISAPEPPLQRVEMEIEDSARPRSKFRIFSIMSALFLSLFLAALDTTIVATAIPTITSHFHSASGYTWVGSAYLLSNAAAGPIWAKLSDIWGRKPVLLAAVAVFAIGSLVCAVSSSMGMLIAGRAVQGAAAGGLMILVNICVSDLFSMRDRSLFYGMLEFVWATAAGVGPILGGTFTQLVSWRWIWYINLPFCALAFLILLIFLDVHNPRTKILEGLKAVDWFGGISILGLVLMLLLGLDFGGETFPWNSPRVICLIVFGLLMSVFFVLSEAKIAKYPIMPLGMFRHRSNIASLVVCFAHGMVQISGEYYLPLLFQSVRSATPLQSGTLLLPLILAEALTGILAGVIIHHTGKYTILIYFGTGILALGYGLFIHLNAYSPLSQIIPFQIVAGIGAGLLFQPPMIALQAHVSQADTATATATFEFIRNLAYSFSIVIGGIVFQNSMKMRGPFLLAAGIPKNVTEMLSGADAAANVMLVGTLPTGQKAAAKEAFAWSLRNMWILYVVVAGLGFVGAFFVGEKVLERGHTETVTGLREKEEGVRVVGGDV